MSHCNLNNRLWVYSTIILNDIATVGNFVTQVHDYTALLETLISCEKVLTCIHRYFYSDFVG